MWVSMCVFELNGYLEEVAAKFVDSWELLFFNSNLHNLYHIIEVKQRIFPISMA